MKMSYLQKLRKVDQSKSDCTVMRSADHKCVQSFEYSATSDEKSKLKKESPYSRFQNEFDVICGKISKKEIRKDELSKLMIDPFKDYKIDKNVFNQNARVFGARPWNNKQKQRGAE